MCSSGLDPARFHNAEAYRDEAAGYRELADTAEKLQRGDTLDDGDRALLRARLGSDDLDGLLATAGEDREAQQLLLGRLLDLHGIGRVMFRNVRVRELPPNPGKYWEQAGFGRKSLTAAGEAMGWGSLFNGEDLTGWDAAGDGSGYRVQDGVLEFLTEGGSPYLATEKDYTDFQLRMDFKISAMANSGLFLRAARSGGNPAFSGCEIQILDDFNWEKETGSKLKPYQFSGGLYGSLAPGVTNALKPLGEWNTYFVTYKGSRILTVLNGRILYDVDTFDLKPEQGAPWKDRAPTGFIGLQRHAPGGALEGDAYASFRNLYIRELQGRVAGY